jgi:hypothetical protein
MEAVEDGEEDTEMDNADVPMDGLQSEDSLVASAPAPADAVRTETIRVARVKWFLSVQPSDGNVGFDPATRMLWSSKNFEAATLKEFIPLHRITGRFVPLHRKEKLSRNLVNTMRVCPLPVKIYL